MRIQDRIITAIPEAGIDIKTLRENLADLPAQPFDYALQGLIARGEFRLLDGFICRTPRGLGPLNGRG
jgi:hypothetical protein